MGEIRKLVEDREFDRMTDILANAYPFMGIVPTDKRAGYAENMRKRHAEFEEYHLYGYFRDGEMLGGMAMHDFQMSWFGETVLPAGGVGMVAVDLLHKKERIAYDLLQFYLNHFREQGASMALLYPFRPDFYKKMGFGLGTKLNRYEVSPGTLPQGPSKDRVVYLNAEQHQESLRACYDRFARSRHGLMLRTDDEASRLFPAGSQLVRMGVQDGDELRGYMVFYYEKVEESNFILHNLVVREFVYETPDAMLEMMTFLRSQSDQFHRVVFLTQDEEFHHLLEDPRYGTNRMLAPVYHESNTQGVGIMYRILNLPDTLQKLHAHNFGGQTCAFHLNVEDSFMNEQTHLQLRIEKGTLTVVEHTHTSLNSSNAGGPVADAGTIAASTGFNSESVPTLRLSIADFSSLLMGTATLKSLYRYGSAQLSDISILDALHRAFLTDEKPMCMSSF
ncbi:GNAT family N-acetyltransferase [Tumebacillus sp. ITR2]|uniref:GNAT family N-acetyltransferase n=1 Tax=Tumebacillus amylolyticus TaxID=2801339 RepID=A0ABS1JFK0_9BACL|nr:GNAT family N-acetyltransferase [Tumebacillus amylolyticus]MBL0389065.1 GNAT family N-acetyltransferase [Tumebacillus amylolyticus]